jgi:hypothetical protein
MSGERSEDELARTATAPPSDSAPATPAAPLGTTLGRYRLERSIGEGGMGVVHAAFDPDLERRVALKVLRSAEGGDEARQRLLREARAMARLTHPNVVTVHEVGSASGRDYVAMELVDGESLAEWLRAEKRDPAEILAAFVAAGRGLAAAHAAGLVHRDFKPHNVLRRKDGRICVTDFGLARGVDTGTGLEATVRLGKDEKPSENTPSPLSGLTATGSVLGTPAYMAPEQWTGGTVGPAADQFAFCVALWEALTGERPFRGGTVEALKAEVQKGPAELDAGKLPRELRAVLRRGLDPDPAKRWPSMDALLAAIAPSQRRRNIALAAVGSALVIAGSTLALFHGRAAGPSCEPPARALEDVWPGDAGKVLAAAGRGELRDAFQHDIDAWSAERDHACTLPPDHRAPQLACLDGVLARLDAVHHAAEKVSGEVPADAVLALLVDPKVCSVASPPRLTVAPDADTVAALALTVDALRGKQLRAAKSDDAAALAAKPGIAPCARAYALRAELELLEDVPKSKAVSSDAITAAEACGDDRVRAEVLTEDAPLQYEQPNVGPRGRAALEKAKAAVDRVSQPDLVARIDEERAEILASDHRWDDAFAAAEHAIAGFAARGRIRGQIGAVDVENDVRFSRGEVADMEAAEKDIEKWKQIARAHHFEHQVEGMEHTEAYAMLFLGDVMGAHAELLRLYHPEPQPDVPTQRIDGSVVDEAGKPIAGAIVAVGSSFFVDSVGPSPFSQTTSDLRMVTSDPQGNFTIPDAPMTGALLAQLGLRRGVVMLAAHAKIVIHETRKLAGKVELGSTPRPKVFVLAIPVGEQERTVRYMAPLLPDGTFELLAAPKDKLAVGVATWGTAYSSDVEFRLLQPGGDVNDLVLQARRHSGRSLEVIARSAVAGSLDAAQVIVMPGKWKFKKVADMFHHHDGPGSEDRQLLVRYAKPIVGESVPDAARGKTQAGDLIAHFEDVHAGEVTACVIGLAGDTADPQVWRKINAHANELDLQCETAGPDDKVLVVEAPPQKRFD